MRVWGCDVFRVKGFKVWGCEVLRVSGLRLFGNKA